MTGVQRRDEPKPATHGVTTGEAPGLRGIDGFAPELGDMSPDKSRHHGWAVVDWIAEYFERIEQLPVLAQIEPNELISKLPVSPPETGELMRRSSDVCAWLSLRGRGRSR